MSKKYKHISMLNCAQGRNRATDARIFNPQLIECANCFSWFLNTGNLSVRCKKSSELLGATRRMFAIRP